MPFLHISFIYTEMNNPRQYFAIIVFGIYLKDKQHCYKRRKEGNEMNSLHSAPNFNVFLVSVQYNL